MQSYFSVLVAAMIVGGVATLVFSRICLWLASSLGDTRARVLVAHLVTLLVGVTSAAFVFRNGEELDLLRGAVSVAPVQVLWLVWDLGAHRRRARAAAQARAQAEAEAAAAALTTPNET